MVQWELDSFYFKFKNLLLAEKDATLTFKSEAGRASVTLSLDLGHVLSGQDQLPPSGHRNGPARQRRREKRAAARSERLSAENVEVKEKESAEKVEEEPSIANSAAEEAKRIETAAKANELGVLDVEKKTAEEVDLSIKDLEDEVCPDEIYENQPKKLISVETQTLECGIAPTAASKSVFDYTFRYDDHDV